MNVETMRALPSENNRRSYNGHYHDVGKYAEELVLPWLKSHPDVLSVDDLRDLRPMQKADVDAILYTRDGLVALVEIKSDYHLGASGNILFEVLRINHTAPSDFCCALGWSARSPAKWLAIYAPQTECVWLASFEDYRDCFQTYTKNQRDKTRVIWVNTDSIKSTLNILIPYTAMGCFTKHSISAPANLLLGWNGQEEEEFVG